MDKRLGKICVYCGGSADTQDHVPSKCFLDEPYPDNLKIVQCCGKCNHRFSLDEEYISCLIDCMKEKTTDLNLIKREKTRETLSHSFKLHDRITKQFRNFADVEVCDIETHRLKLVVYKLAYGHLAYENSSLNWDSEPKINMWILDTMPKTVLEDFEKPYYDYIVPEVGCNCLSPQGGFHIIVGLDEPSFCSNWIIVQKRRYRYCVSPDSTKVKFVIAEFLAVEVLID